MKKRITALACAGVFASVAHASNLQSYCPMANQLRFDAKVYDKHQEPSYGLMQAKKDSVEFNNPYMRSKHEYPQYVPAPNVNASGEVTDAVSDAREPYYQNGSLFCYYAYPHRDNYSTWERLVMASSHDAFHQCKDGRVLPVTQAC